MDRDAVTAKVRSFLEDHSADFLSDSYEGMELEELMLILSLRARDGDRELMTFFMNELPWEDSEMPDPLGLTNPA